MKNQPHVGMKAGRGSSIIYLIYHSFNILIVILAAYDTWYIFGAVLETIRKFFVDFRSDVHLILFPHFLYPLHQTSITGSIFMTITLAFERYNALNYPIEYNRVSFLFLT